MSASGTQHGAVPVICVASAGTGKTYWLTEEFFAALREAGYHDAHRLVAITFTENAANEMRSRIQHKLLRELGLGALPLAEELNISTIHSFCRTELARHAAELGLNPALEVLDEPRAGQIARSVLLGVLRDRHRRGGKPFELLAENLPFNSYFGIGQGTSLEGALLDLYRKLRSRGVTELNTELFETAEISWDEAREQVAADLARISALTPEDAGTDYTRKALAQVRGIIEGNRSLLRRLEPTESTARALQEISAACKLNTRGMVKQAFAAFKGEKGSPGSYDLAMQALAAIAARPLRDEVISILAELDARLNSQKHAAGVMDFEDLQLTLLRALQEDAELRAEYRRRFTGVFVDEFQDTNPLQVAIIELMAEKRALRYVGDPKQSVYGWRYAEPETIRLRRREFAETGRVEKLTHNYRSRPEILELVNALCGRWGDALGFEYDNLVPAAARMPEFGFRGQRRPCVAVFPAPVGDDEKLLRTEESKPLMAAKVAAYIKQAVEEERFRHTSNRREDAPLGYSDFAILFRKNEPLRHYEAALARAGVPFVSETSTGFLETPEIAAVLGMLRTLLMPENDWLLAEALRSDLVGLSSTGIAELAAAAPAPSRGRREKPFVRALRDGAAFTSAEDAAAVAEWLEWRNMLAAEIELLTPAEVVESVTSGLRLREKLMARGAPERSLWNLDKLLDFALGVSSRGISGVAELVEVLAETEYQRQNIGEMWLEGPDSVRLMTVHKAKGLTIPAVIIAEAGTRSGDSSPLLTVEPSARNPGKYELGVQHRFLSGRGVEEPFLSRHKQASKERSSQEEARLLYVALTRAVEHIAIFGLIPKPHKQAPWRALLAPLVELQEGKLVVAPEFAGLVELHDTGKPDTPKTESETPDLAELIAQHTPTGGKGSTMSEAEALLAEAETAPDTCRLQRYLFSVHDVMAFAESDGREAHGAAASSSSADGPELGTAIHDLLAYALRHPGMLASPAATKELLSDELVAERFPQHEPVLHRNSAAAHRFISNFSATGLPERALRADTVEVELPFLLAAAGIHLRGRFDLLLREKNSLAVLDFKTDSLRGRSAQELAAEYEMQMLLYTLAARELHPGMHLTAGLVLLDAGEILWVNVAEDRLRALSEETLPHFAQAMKKRYAGVYTWRPASWRL